MKCHIAAALLLGTVSCQAPNEPTPEPRQDLQTFEFEVKGMTCDMCAGTATGLLADIPGVHDARVDFETGSGVAFADERVTASDIRSALSSYGFEGRFPGDDPADSVPLSGEERPGLDIRTVSHGEVVNVEAELAPRKVTIFDYYADWCGPCHLLTPKLERLVKRYGNVALRKVDIVDWESEAAKQATREFRLSGLPYVRVYAPDGRVLGSVVGNHVEQVEALIEGRVQR